MWLINRSKTLDVTSFTINQTKGGSDTDKQYTYPMVYTDKPLHGSSLASYHTPTDAPFSVEIHWRDSESDNTGVIGPFEVQFPRAADYKYYLYRTETGEIVAVTDDKIKELPPDPDDTVPSDVPSFPIDVPALKDAHTLVVLNVSPDQDIDEVQLVKESYTYAIVNEPRAKDQQMILLGAGSYKAKASYKKGETSYETEEKTAVVTEEAASMALRTNFLYFYKTAKGDYQLTQNWPPIPNDAADGNRPEDALLETQGILEIHNNAIPNNPHALIARINVNGTEYPNNTNMTSYMAPGDPPKRYILSVGPAYVSFMPTDQTFYGQTSMREIESRKTTVLSYINDLGDPVAFPEDTGNGSGLIRIVNNSAGVVVSAAVYDKDDPLVSLTMGYEDFSPPLPVQYGNVGLVPVVGTEEVPLRPGVNQLVQVLLETVNGIVVVEKVVALKGQIVTIKIDDENLEDNQRAGSKVTVSNNTNTPTTILNLYVYNQENSDITALYSLDVSNQETQTLYVLSTTGMPIVQGVVYKAKLVVSGNGNIAIIEKDFGPDGQLYSLNPDTHTRTITLNQSDLPPALVLVEEDFKPVTGLAIAPNPYSLNSATESDPDGSNKILKTGGTVALNDIITISPADATKKSPIEWSTKRGAFDKVSLTSNGLLAVTGIADPENDTVTVSATIRNAAGTGTGNADFTADIVIQLTYENTIRTPPPAPPVEDFKPVTGLTIAPNPYPVNSTTKSDLDGGNKTLETGGTVTLNEIMTISPADATKKSPIEWSLEGGAFNKVSLNSNGLLAVTGIADPGNDTVTVRATIRNAGTGNADFTADVVIQLTYENTIRTVKVGDITLAAPTVQTGQSLDLISLVTLNPPNANINGVPITPADIIWSIEGTPGDSSIVDSTFTAGTTTGSVTIKATLPADKNGGTAVTETAIITIAAPPVIHTNITSIGLSGDFPSVPFYTKNVLVSGQKTKIVYDSTGVYLSDSANLTFNPPTATIKSPVVWSAVSGSAVNKVFFRTDSSPQYIYVRRSNTPENAGEPILTGAIPIDGEELKVKATVQNAQRSGSDPDYTYSDFESGEFTVSLQEFYSNNVVDLSTDFSLDPASLEVEQSIDLKTLAHLPADATRYVNGSPVSITVNDLTWQIVGSSNGTHVSGSSLTAGTVPGTVTIRATLPANKNEGQVLTRTQTIAITKKVADTLADFSLDSASLSFGESIDLRTLAHLPANAVRYVNGSIEFITVNDLTWQILSGGGTLSGSLFTGTAPGTVTIRATLPANKNGGQVLTRERTIAVTKYVTDTPPADFSFNSTSLNVGQSINLKTLAHLPANAVRYVEVNGNASTQSITINDLTWLIVSGGSSASLSGSVLTGTAVGTVTVRATLPANKNGGLELIRNQTITITSPVAPPPPPPTYPSTFTLRIIKLNGASDHVSQIALIPVPAADSKHNYNDAIYRTGHTKIQWAMDGNDITHLANFKKTAPANTQYISICKLSKENDWTNVTIPWPANGVIGYYLFFIEGDGRVRGYVNPGKLDPQRKENFLFLLRPEYLYDNQRMWMFGVNQVAPNSLGSLYVIPIGYHSYDNTASVMKAAGVGKRPTHDLSDY
jgi:hypothetical protein